MIRFSVFICLVLLSTVTGKAQLITLDGNFDDWKGIDIETDPANDGGGLDLLECAITHDDNYLFIRVKTAQEYGMINPGYTNSQLHIYIDTDFNASTGRQDHSLGTELKISCGDKEVLFDYPTVGAHKGSLYDVGFLSLPTVTNEEFEIAIQRDAKPDGTNNLFLEDSIRLFLFTTEGDYLPKKGTAIKHVFANNNPPKYSSIGLERASGKNLRVMSYNVERGGLIDAGRQQSLKRIITAASPDVIGFSETQGSASQIADLLDDWIPLQGSWYTDKQGSNVIASRFPITFSQPVWQSSVRSMGSVIDLPDMEYSTDVLVITSHPNCCSADAARQSQVDMIASFILDAKSKGGVLDLADNTPILIVGDFNLVGWQAQLNTLLNGTIQDESTYGKGGGLDWDDGAMESASCLHTEVPFSHTWRSASSSFSPGKLDYIFYSGTVLNELKSFTLDTESMPSSKLNKWGLQAHDALNASDHLPLVADFSINETPTSLQSSEESNVQVFPNPVGDQLNIQCKKDSDFQLFDSQGKVVLKGFVKAGSSSIQLTGLQNGLYLLVLSSNQQSFKLIIE